MKILLVGGGSGGPVSPLLAVAEEIKKNHPSAKFLLVGTNSGPEKHMARAAGLDFTAISAAKLRRYFSWRNFLAPFLLAAGFFQSLKLLASFRPDCVLGAGSFAQVPLVWAAWILKIPVVLHQQDLLPGLANKLCELAASTITVSFEASLKSFPSNFGFFYKNTRRDKIILTGNPFRQELKSADKQESLKFFNLRPDMPTLLVLGGGTGAEFLNDLVCESLARLAKTVQIIHSAGPGKLKAVRAENYRGYEFIDNMAAAYAAADLVVCRGGLSTITELSNLKKLSIIIPLPRSPQEINAMFLARANAAIILSQNEVTSIGLINLVRKLLFAHDLRQQLKNNIFNIMPKNAGEKIAEVVLRLALHY